MVFCRTAEHGWSTNINLLNCLLQGNPRFGNRILEWVEVNDYQIDHLDLMLCGGSLVLIVIPKAKKTSMDFGVKSFDTTIHHFGKTRMVADVGNGYSVIP